MILSIFDRKKLYAACTGIATTRPEAVVIKASEIPPATTLGSTSPAAAISLKARIIPDTVPRKPTRGARFATVESHTRPRSRKAISIAPDSSIDFSTCSIPRSQTQQPCVQHRGDRAARIGTQFGSTFWPSLLEGILKLYHKLFGIDMRLKKRVKALNHHHNHQKTTSPATDT